MHMGQTPVMGHLPLVMEFPILGEETLINIMCFIQFAKHKICPTNIT